MLHVARWLAADSTGLDAVGTDALLRNLAANRAGRRARQHENVIALARGTPSGFAPSTINRRLAAISGLFGFRSMRDPDAVNPVPMGTAARRTAHGERTGLLGHLARPKPWSKLRVREPRRLPRGLDRGVQGGVPLDPHVMAKAGLLEAQSPVVNVRTRRNDRHQPRLQSLVAAFAADKNLVDEAATRSAVSEVIDEPLAPRRQPAAPHQLKRPPGKLGGALSSPAIGTLSARPIGIQSTGQQARRSQSRRPLVVSRPATAKTRSRRGLGSQRRAPPARAIS